MGFRFVVLLTTLLLIGVKKYKQTLTKTTIKCLQKAINLTKRHAIALRISYQVIVSISNRFRIYRSGHSTITLIQTVNVCVFNV